MPFRHSIVDEFLALATRTTSGTSSGFNKNDFHEGLMLLDVTAVSGTGPTLDVAIQTSPDNTNWFNLPNGAFTQVVAPGKQVLKADNFGKYIRVAYTIAGTNPSFTFSVVFVGKT